MCTEPLRSVKFSFVSTYNVKLKPVVAKYLDKEEEEAKQSVSYSDLFSTIDKEIIITKINHKIVKTRQGRPC